MFIILLPIETVLTHKELSFIPREWKYRAGQFQKMGLPISHFIASTNLMIQYRFLNTGFYKPKTIQTILNAMDVVNPRIF